MLSQFERRLQELGNEEQLPLLARLQRGLEKESLRITPEGHLAQTPHPQALGSALCNSYITTDYSEALMEFITPVSPSIESTLAVLDDTHRYVYSKLDNELLWGASMPCLLEGDANIPLAQYGSSNVARMKTVYRHGLGVRYGRLMQTIAGIHYNFSMPAAYWQLAQSADGNADSLQDYTTDRYLRLIRNFRRHSWLLIYLFGASPAVCSSFLRGNSSHHLVPFDAAGKSMHAPFGTALRMGDLGYTSNAQQNLAICYNSLSSYIDTLRQAITKPHPAYAALGVGEHGHEIQLSTSLLQIENEFYSLIRPKRVTKSGEPPLAALEREGIEYVEVRCIDVNPFLPLGIEASQMRFLDTFLLYCLLQDSPACEDAEVSRMGENIRRVVERGRDPALQLTTERGEVPLREHAGNLMRQLQPLAEALDRSNGSALHSASYALQMEKINAPELTPSAHILQQMEEQKMPFFRLAMAASQEQAREHRERPLDPARQAHFEQESQRSRRQQEQLEAAENIDFETYLQQYFAQYDSI